MSLKTRMDDRDIEEFASDLALDTAKQRVWAVALQNYFQEKTNSVCDKLEYGVDNDGNVIDGSLPNDNVDNIFIFGNNERKVEIKTIPEWCNNFMTFKASSLRSCIKQKAYIIVPKRFVFYTFSTKMCEYMLKNYSHQIYKGFSPNDLAVRIFKRDIEKFMAQKEIVVKEWTQACRDIVEGNWSLLSREKRRNR